MAQDDWDGFGVVSTCGRANFPTSWVNVQSARLFTGGVKWKDEPRHSRDRWGFHPSEYRREPMFRWPERREQHQ